MMADPQNALAAFTPGGTAPQAPQSQGPRQIAPNVSVTDLNDESVQKYEFKLYSGKTNQIDRIYLVSPGNIVKARQHWNDKLKGGAILCQSTYVLNAQRTQENLKEQAFCCKLLGSPTLRLAALVVKYGTDVKGNIALPFTFEQLLWKFGADKYDQLRTINRDFPLDQHDLSISCSDDKYQKMQIGAKADCLVLHPKFPVSVKQQIDEWARSSLDKLPRELGRVVTEQELMQAMREAGILTTPGGPTPTMVPGAADAPVMNFEDIIATATPGGPAQPTA